MSIFLYIISFLFILIPRKLALFLGKMIGATAYYFFPLRHNVAIQNIKFAFPGLSNSESKTILKKTSMHFGMVLVDFLRQSYLNKDRINKLVRVDEKSLKILDKLDGGIIMTGHMGNWEMFLPALGLNGYPFVVVTQTQKNISSQRFFNKIRSFPNISLIPKNGSRKKMLVALEQNKFLGLASDQNAGARGIKIPFFSIPASIPKGAALFHIKTSMPIIVGFCILSRDLKYDLCFRQIDLSTIPKNKEDAIIAINSQFSQKLEDQIIKHPHQYFWFHRKWEKSIYKKT